MSVQAKTQKMSVPTFRDRKGSEKLVMLTAYTAPMARLLTPYVDALLVGDSVGMVLHGLPSTLGVTPEMMILHSAAVRRGAPDALVIADLPFGSYQASPQQAYETSARLLAETGIDAVKLEGGTEMADTIRFLTQRGIPVMGHIGLMPQRINQMGSYRAQGRSAEAAEQIKQDAIAVTNAGAFAIVVEGVLETIAADITRTVSVPTIGIGASPVCDGQILVSDDLLGLFSDFRPKFVRRYADLSNEISTAVEAYAKDVRSGAFPSDKECFK